MTDSSDPLKNLPLVTEPHLTKRAAGWQIILTVFGFVAIVTLFFFGINHQRNETGSEQTAATTPTPVAPQGGDTQQGQGQQQSGQQPPPSTTGQGGGEDKSDQKGPPQPSGQKKEKGQPAGDNGQPAPRQSK
jgi:hypothetical protein